MKPSSNLDPCLSGIQEVANRLTSLVIGEDCKLDEYLKKSNINQAAQLARTVLASANLKTDCGETLDENTKTNVRYV